MADGIPHIAFPFRIDATTEAVATVEQDTEDEILQSVLVLMLTERGSREELPEYGIPPILFAENIDRGTILYEISQWEPRANVMVTDRYDLIDEFIRQIQIRSLPALNETVGA